jgi:hypothetical protein
MYLFRIMFELLSKPAMKELIADTPEVAILFMESLHELVNLFLLDNHSIFAAFIATTGSK